MKLIKFLLFIFLTLGIIKSSLAIDALQSASSKIKVREIYFKSDGTKQTTAGVSSNNPVFTGTVTASGFSGNGVGLTGINSSFSTTTGSVSVNQLPAGSVTTVTFGATSTVSVANVNTPQMFRLVLTGATTIVFDNVGTGTMFTLMLVQDGTGTRTAQYGTTTTYFSGGTKPTLTATPLATDMLEFKGYNNVAINTGLSPDVK